jgi:predicted nucleotidyltransferase component of viral defense system
VIPEAFITEWRHEAPWPDDTQVEQDLILSRLIVEIATHELLGPELSFRGGTCLHKLRLPTPARYSEDLDYVRRSETGIGPYLDALSEVAGSMGLRRIGTDTSGTIVTAKYEADPSSAAGRIRVKIEINIEETTPFRPWAEIPYVVNSAWWSGEGQINSFTSEELLGTKLRALYQRSKGRDLFDLWCALTQLSLDEKAIVDAFKHYIREEEFTFPQLARNLEIKLKDEEFRSDLSQLVLEPPDGYDPDSAADLVMSRLGILLRNAPDPGALRRDGWRTNG